MNTTSSQWRYGLERDDIIWYPPAWVRLYRQHRSEAHMGMVLWRLARDWQLRFQPVDTGGASVNTEQIRTTVWFGDDLIADAAQIPSYLITRGAAATSKVFLSGMGADELFLGYGGHKLTLAWQFLDRLPLPAALMRRVGRIDQRRGALKAFRRYLYRLGKYDAYPNYRFGIFSIIGDSRDLGRRQTPHQSTVARLTPDTS